MARIVEATDVAASLSQALGIAPSAPAGPSADRFVSSSPPVTASAPVVSQTPQPGQGIATDARGALPTAVAAQAVEAVTADPVSPVVGQIWYRSDTSQLCVRHSSTTTKRVTLA